MGKSKFGEIEGKDRDTAKALVEDAESEARGEKHALTHDQRRRAMDGIVKKADKK